uniref:CSON009003 protein n=1 Tax=Culicoides sonorensis TaxID=179676 RepID=A0A336N250_CULSO
MITNNKKKMKVLNTVQVFSATVAKALLAYADMGKIEADEAIPLAKFINTVNNLFDVFNGSHTEKHPIRQPFTGQNCEKNQVDFLVKLDDVQEQQHHIEEEDMDMIEYEGPDIPKELLREIGKQLILKLGDKGMALSDSREFAVPSENFIEGLEIFEKIFRSIVLGNGYKIKTKFLRNTNQFHISNIDDELQMQIREHYFDFRVECFVKNVNKNVVIDKFKIFNYV